MAEVAGLVLGGIPIAIWALEKYAEPFEAHQNYSITIQTFRADLNMQRYHLEKTLSRMGLENPSTAELRECLKAKFPSIHEDMSVIIRAMDERTSKLLRDLKIDANGQPEWTEDPPERARWEWRRVKRSFASKKTRSLIDDLRKWNEDLKNCVEQTEVSAEDDTRQVQALIRGFNPKHCESIRSCLRSFHRALRSALQCKCVSYHEATIDLDWNSGPLRSPWVFTAGLSYETCPESAHLWRKFHVTPGGNGLVHSKASTMSSSSAASKTSSSSLLFDVLHRSSRRTQPTTPQAVQNTTPSPPPAKSIVNLCDQVRTQCASWSINGCLQNPDVDKDRQFLRFSLNKHSEDLSSLARTISLRHLLLSQNGRQVHAHLTLSAKQRYAIATSIAWSVLHLSDSPWLTGGWSQDEIKFFVDEDSEGMQLLSQLPSTSYEFHTPTMNKPPFPETTDFSGLIPNKSIFTLGVILIELCLKQPLEELRQTLYDQSRGQVLSDPTLDQYHTAIDRLDDVYREGGDLYGNAVQRCIKCSFEGSKSTKRFNIEQFRMQFYNTVVAPVQARYCMTPA
ncbi:hypothetical protein ACHAPT_012318 [Fusarium lateritium]